MRLFINKLLFTIPLMAFSFALLAQQPEQILKASGSPANP